MSSINSVTVSTQTMSFDEIVEQAVKDKQSKAEKMIEELRPLCEEMPECTLDPVTYEVFKEPLAMRCSHSIGANTLSAIGKANGYTMSSKVPCPLCRIETTGKCFIYEQSFDETIQHLKKITEVFTRGVENAEEKAIGGLAQRVESTEPPRKKTKKVARKKKGSVPRSS